jgi:hypothetical protein
LHMTLWFASDSSAAHRGSRRGLFG